MYDFWNFVRYFLGLDVHAPSLGFVQVGARAAVIFIVGLVMLRIGEHRFIGRNTAFDVVLGFIFGSMLSRAINGSGPFLETLVAALVLLFLHWVFATLSFRSGRLDALINGRAVPVVRDGVVQEDEMRKKRLNRSVLEENLRLRGGLTTPDAIEGAYFERNGNISIIPKQDDAKERAPRVVEIRVEAGVQTVRVEFG